jgi:uncharacterized membrane protein YtjA (UPF0391 family)
MQTTWPEVHLASQTKGFLMLRWAAIFFVLALIAAVFGFTGIASSAAGIAKILFIGFVIVAIISMVFGLFRRESI